MHKSRHLAIVMVLLALVMGLAPASSGVASDGNGKLDSIIKNAATGKLKPATFTVPAATKAKGASPVTKTAPFFSSGVLYTALSAITAEDLHKEGADVGPGSDFGSASPGENPGTLGCSQRLSRAHGNVRVNQDCDFRRQAEEDITYNPADPNNLLAGQNDSRVGFNQCGIDWSTDNGRHWGDMLPPFRQKLNNPAAEMPTATDPNRHTILGGPGTLHTYDAASDPTVAFDSQGRAFFSCVAFDVFSNASMVFVVTSPKGAQGSFFFTISNMFSRQFIVAEDNSSLVFHDKEFITADSFADSPNRDNVYITWTVFRFSPNCGPQPNPNQDERFCASPIYGSMSTDHGFTWSTPEEISGVSPSLCFFGNFFDPTHSPNACDFDQGSDPEVLPNGDLEVIFNNGNTAAGNPNGQQLGVHCRPSGSSPAGTAHFNCAAPSKVGDDVITGEPLCDFGRGPEECIPGAYIRTNDFPRIAVNRANGHLFATWQDYRNGEYDIQLTQSTDGGQTWSNSVTVNPDTQLDHYFPAVAIATNGNTDRVGVSYFRTERVPNENTTPKGGFAPGMLGVQTRNSDYVLAGGRTLEAPYDFTVLSPVFAPPDGIQAGFNGDYSGLTINKGDQAHPIWSDTRNISPYPSVDGVIHDEDVFTDNTGLPQGKAKPGVGHIGKR